MSKRNTLAGALVGILCACVGLGAVAQDHARVDRKTDWSVFQAGEGTEKVCWIGSTPTESVALRGGQRVQVRRGDIFLMVSVRPGDGVNNEVVFLSGYPFKSGSEVEAQIGSGKYEMFTEGENAWMRSSQGDDRLVQAFRRGATAKISGMSSRGTKTIDTFSLRGFTAALADATSRCQVQS